MKLRISPVAVLAIALLMLSACADKTAPQPPATAPTPASPPATEISNTQSPGPELPATPRPVAVATRIGADYVLRLPREAAIPADWAMSTSPDFKVRDPEPGETYHFACLDLPARSVGIASVGYRSLEGLPNVHIEYVIYPTDEAASAALADMRRAAETCEQFAIGDGEGATAAAFAPLEFPDFGDASFAASLSTDSPVTGQLLTHMIKIRIGHVVIGIHHANYADEPPDSALSESLAALAVGNLKDRPIAAGEK